MPFPKLFYYYRYRLTGEKATPNSQKINLAFFFLPNAKLGGEGRMRAVQHLEAPLFLRPLLWSWGAPTGCRWGAGGTPNLAAWCQYSRRVLVGPGAPPAPRHLGGPAMQKQETLCWGRTGLGGTGRDDKGLAMCHGVPLSAQPLGTAKGTQSTPGHVPWVRGDPLGAGVLPCLACPGDRR